MYCFIYASIAYLGTRVPRIMRMHVRRRNCFFAVRCCCRWRCCCCYSALFWPDIVFKKSRNCHSYGARAPLSLPHSHSIWRSLCLLDFAAHSAHIKNGLSVFVEDATNWWHAHAHIQSHTALATCHLHCFFCFFFGLSRCVCLAAFAIVVVCSISAELDQWTV